MAERWGAVDPGSDLRRGRRTPRLDGYGRHGGTTVDAVLPTWTADQRNQTSGQNLSAENAGTHAAQIRAGKDRG